MAIPGQNLLNMALTIIAKQAITYYEFANRTINSVGQEVTVYEPGRIIYGSFQPVPRQVYEIYGLDLQKSYYNFYSSNNVLDISRDISGDQIAFDTKRYQVESNTDWYKLDGWKGILCVYIGDDIADQYLFGFGSLTNPNSYKNFNNGTFIAGAS